MSGQLESIRYPFIFNISDDIEVKFNKSIIGIVQAN